MRYLLLATVCMLELLLNGCSNKTDELQTYIEDVKKRPPQKLPPLPEIKPFQVFTYSARNLRSPFQKSTDVENAHGIRPDMNRPKEPLEAFPLDSLKMVGILSQGNKLWALVTNHEGVVYRVLVGNYIGQNYGKVLNITKDKMEIMEMVPDQGGWIQRPAALVVTDQSAN